MDEGRGSGGGPAARLGHGTPGRLRRGRRWVVRALRRLHAAV